MKYLYYFVKDFINTVIFIVRNINCTKLVNCPKHMFRHIAYQTPFLVIHRSYHYVNCLKYNYM